MKLTKSNKVFICLIGIDGSGKTTLSTELVKFLERKGIKFHYVYNRYTPYILRPFMIIANKIFMNKCNFSRNYNNYSAIKKEKIVSHNNLSRIYQLILIIDYYIQTFFRITIPLKLGTNIVCDRYIYDTVATDLSVDFNYSKDDIEKVSMLMNRFFPRPDIIFFLDVPEIIAYSRKDDLPSIDYLTDRKSAFVILADLFNMRRLDGTKPIDKLIYDIECELEA